MKRRSFFGWLGAGVVGGFAGLFHRETQEQKLLRLIREAEKDPSAWRVYASGEDVTKDVRDLVLRCKKCGAQYDPISEKRRFDEHVARCRVLPEVIDTNHPEAPNIEVLDERGDHLGAVFELDTRTQTAHRYCVRRLPEGEWRAKNCPPPYQCDIDPSTGQVRIEKVRYARLRMRDGRDVLEVLGV